jgi:hypothetical protein
MGLERRHEGSQLEHLLLSSQASTVTTRKGWADTAPSALVVAGAIVLGLFLGTVGKILDDHGPSGSAAVLSIPSVWIVLCWWCGARTERRNVALMSACGLLLASIVSYYTYDGIRLDATRQTELDLAAPWLALALPTALISATAGSLARRETRFGAVCRAVPVAMLTVSVAFMVTQEFTASGLWSTATLAALTAAVLRSTPWRQNVRILIASSLLAAAASVITFALVITWANSTIGP